MGTEVRELRIRAEFVGGHERRTRLLMDQADDQPPIELYEGQPLSEVHVEVREQLARMIFRDLMHLEADAMRAVLDPLVDLPKYVDFGPKKGF